MNFSEGLSSSFKIKEIDHDRKMVIVEDERFGLEIEIPNEDRQLENAEIIAPYEIKLIFTDGIIETQRILD